MGGGLAAPWMAECSMGDRPGKLQPKDILMSVLKSANPPVIGNPPALKGPSKKNARHTPAEGLTELLVWSVPAVNRRLLICHLPGSDGSNPMNLVSVAVRDNSMFLKKMALWARQVNDKKYDLHGPLPRWRGKW